MSKHTPLLAAAGGRILIATLLLAPTLLPASAPALAAEAGHSEPVAVDRVIALAGRDVVTARELDRRVALVKRRLTEQGGTLPPDDVLRRQVLERLILDRLQIQHAREIGAEATPEDIDRAIDKIAASNGLSLAEFRARITADGVSFDSFRQDIADQITLSRLREREILTRVNVTPAEVDRQLRRQQQQGGEVAYALAHILVALPEGADPATIAEARQRAEKALAEIRSGRPFAEAAAVYSDAPDALQGGQLGWRNPARLPDLFVSTAEGMTPGETSAVLRSPGGFHILRLLERRGGNSEATEPVRQHHVRHILVRVDEDTPEDKARERIETLRVEINEGADFADVARAHSQDASAGRGGDIGWVHPGQTVPEFEEVMIRLEPGTLSEPVRSPFGWHLMEVLEVRDGELAPEQQRARVAQELRERKADAEYQDWLRRLRDRSYVEYRLDPEP